MRTKWQSMMERPTKVRKKFRRQKSHWLGKLILRVRVLSTLARVAFDSPLTFPSLKGTVCVHSLCPYLQPFVFTHSCKQAPFSSLSDFTQTVLPGTSPFVRASEESSRSRKEPWHQLHCFIRSGYGSELVHQSVLASTPISTQLLTMAVSPTSLYRNEPIFSQHGPRRT
jgi:hypothetical protein